MHVVFKFSLNFRSAYHGHLTSMIDISPYKFNQIKNGKKDWVHVVRLKNSLFFHKYKKKLIIFEMLFELWRWLKSQKKFESSIRNDISSFFFIKRFFPLIGSLSWCLSRYLSRQWIPQWRFGLEIRWGGEKNLWWRESQGEENSCLHFRESHVRGWPDITTKELLPKRLSVSGEFRKNFLFLKKNLFFELINNFDIKKLWIF